MKKLPIITKNQIAEKGVSALSDRPNASAQYGVGGLSPQQLKLWFDKLSTYLAEKINAVSDALSNNDAAEYIRIALDDLGVETLDDLVSAMTDGSFAENVLKLFPAANSETAVTLREFAVSVSSKISEMLEDLENVWAECGTSMSVTLDTSTYLLTLHLYNDAGEVLSVQIVSLLVNTERIIDGAVTTPKINDSAVTTAKIGNAAVTTEKIASKNVTTDKIADTAVTTEKVKDQNITTAKIKDSAVVTQKINDSAVTTAKIGNAAVTAEKLSAGSVNETKLSSALVNRILTLEREAFTSIAYDPSTGKLTFTAVNGSTESVDLPLELITSGGYYDDTDGAEAAVLVLANGEEIRIPVDSMLSKIVAYINGIREKIYDLQEAPHISALSDTILLPTPTLSQLAALMN